MSSPYSCSVLTLDDQQETICQSPRLSPISDASLLSLSNGGGYPQAPYSLYTKQHLPSLAISPSPLPSSVPQAPNGVNPSSPHTLPKECSLPDQPPCSYALPPTLPKECMHLPHAHLQPYLLPHSSSYSTLSFPPPSPPETLTLELSGPIGSGAYGTIHSSFWNYQLVAVKKIYQRENQALIHREIKLNSLLRHRHIIQFLGMGVIDGNLVMITDLAENGSLERVIRLKNRSGEKLDWDTKTRITSETTSALAYLHSLGIIHRDVKSANILLNKHFEVRLCDLSHVLFTSVPDILDDKGSFGCSTKALVGTIRWMAPELLGTAPEYSFKSDMYALGMVMWEMAANCTIPYQDKPNNNRVVEYVLSGGRETIPSDTPDEYRQCIERCWDQDPFKRPNASEMVPKPSIRFEYLATKGESMISDSTSSSSIKNDDDWPLPNNHQVKCSPTFALPVNAVATTNTLSSRTLADDGLLQMAASGVLPLPQENIDGVFDTLPILNLWTLRPTLPYLSEISDICANCFHQVSMGNKSSQLFLAVGVFAAVKAFQLTILQHITGCQWLLRIIVVNHCHPDSWE